MIQRCCECGATVKVADVGGETERAILDLFDELHRDHEQVTAAEATEIRRGVRQRGRERRAQRRAARVAKWEAMTS